MEISVAKSIFGLQQMRTILQFFCNAQQTTMDDKLSLQQIIRNNIYINAKILTNDLESNRNCSNKK